jgi:hypothetical protein
MIPVQLALKVFVTETETLRGGGGVHFFIVMSRNVILSFLCPFISLPPCPQHAVLRCVLSTSSLGAVITIIGMSLITTSSGLL